MTAPINGTTDTLRRSDLRRTQGRIRKALRARSAKEVADAIGSTEQSVRNWEAGKCAMTPKYAARVQSMIRDGYADQDEVDALLELASGMTVRQKLALAKALVMDAMSSID